MATVHDIATGRLLAPNKAELKRREVARYNEFKRAKSGLNQALEQARGMDFDLSTGLVILPCLEFGDEHAVIVTMAPRTTANQLQFLEKVVAKLRKEVEENAASD